MSQEENFISEILELLIERAKEAKENATENGSIEKRGLAFEEGRAIAYYEVISTIVNQSKTFGLSAERIPHLGFDPDKELL